MLPPPAAAVFLGGWTVPGLAPGEQGSRLIFEVLGSAVYLAKVVALIAGLAILKGVAARVAAAELTAFALKAIVPAAAVALAASLAWAGVRLHPDWQRLVGIVDAALFALVLGRLMLRVRLYRTVATGDARLNPFL